MYQQSMYFQQRLPLFFAQIISDLSGEASPYNYSGWFEYKENLPILTQWKMANVNSQIRRSGELVYPNPNSNNYRLIPCKMLEYLL